MKNDDAKGSHEGADRARRGPVTQTQEDAMNAIHPHPLKTNETTDAATPVAETAAPDTRADRRPGLGDRPQAGSHAADHDSAPPVAGDPAVAAAKDAREAEAAFNTLGATVDESSPEFVAAEKRTTEADAVFADAPVTSAAGALAKMQELKVLVFSPELDADEKGLDVRHLETVVTFLEGGAAAGAGCDPVVALYMKLGAISDEAIAIYETDPARTEPETDTLWYAALDRRDAVLDRIEETPATSAQGMAIKTQLASDYAVNAAGDENLTLTEEEREFIAEMRRMSRAQAQAMRELLRNLHNGVGPDKADMMAWVDNRTAEIEARSAPVAP